MQKVYNLNLKSKLNGKNCFQINPVKYFRIKTDKPLNYVNHSNEFAINLNRANDILYKVSTNTLKSMFHSHLNYGNLVRGQKRKILRKKALRLMNFKPENFHTCPLCLSLNILKLPDKII